MRLKRAIPFNIQVLLIRLGITLFLLTITRIIFHLGNLKSFSNVLFSDYFYGFIGDAISIGIWFIPFYGLSLLPIPFKSHKAYKLLLKFIFHLTNGIMIGLNLMDLEYFKYTSKRSTSDLFTILGAGEDFAQLFTTFLSDFWWIILIFIVLIWFSNFLYNKTLKFESKREDERKFIWYKDVLYFLVFGFLLFTMGRGGLGYRPADMLTIAQWTSPRNLPLVLNTPLTIIKTIGKKGLEKKVYFEDENIMHQYFNPRQSIATDSTKLKGKNVVVIVLESFGNEWLGVKTGGEFTPFFDSLLNESLYFEKGFANGKKSIEAMPAIFAGIPSLMDNPYISSPYGTNKIKGLPTLLSEKGYSSAFFHGATNGSMKFDEFASIVGFEKYFGRAEYNNEDHTDDTWGVLDEYFNPWTAETITKELSEPFIAGLFTLSSHHPYFIPEEHRDKFPSGPAPIAKSIAYGDYSLRLFFEKAKKQPWFENTVFVLCADHTPAGIDSYYVNSIGRYKIPIAIFDPQKRIKPKRSSKIMGQIDITPSILDLLEYENSFFSFGKSVFKSGKKFTFNFLNETYHLYKDDRIISFQNDELVSIYNFEKDSLMHNDSLKYLKKEAQIYENTIKSIIQQYNSSMINNQLTISDE